MDTILYDDIPEQPRELLAEIHKVDGQVGRGDAAAWWGTRNRTFGNLRPCDVYRSSVGGANRVMTVLNMIADGQPV
jgi:hypothetical protein